MKLKILNVNKTEVGSKDLPKQFEEDVRKDLIKRAFLVSQSAKRQPYGASPEAGKRSSAELSRRRRKYRGSYGLGISRVPRKILSRRGTRMVWVGAFAPGTVGGRRAHPPKSSKIWEEKINKKERRKAVRSALSATLNLDLVKARGHKLPATYPFIIKDDICIIKQTKLLSETLSKIGFQEELERTRKKDSKGLLIVTNERSFHKACANITGFEAINVNLCFFVFSLIGCVIKIVLFLAPIIDP